jgi:hypothetical protein
LGPRRPASRKRRVANPAPTIRLMRPTMPAVECNNCSSDAGASTQRGGGFSCGGYGCAAQRPN